LRTLDAHRRFSCLLKELEGFSRALLVPFCLGFEYARTSRKSHVRRMALASPNNHFAKLCALIELPHKTGTRSDKT
jgi:hypothetical protein